MELTDVLQIVTMTGAAIWGVARIQQAVDRLEHSIQNLSRNVDRQQSWLDVLEHRVQTHSERILALEKKEKDGD